MLFIMFNDFEKFIVIKGNDKEGVRKRCGDREEGPWTERPSDRQFAEGSFGTGYLKPMWDKSSDRCEFTYCCPERTDDMFVVCG